ncbi:MAG: glycosyltransferase family 2 protein [Candidatus Paceibacterota bacterium]
MDKKLKVIAIFIAYKAVKSLEDFYKTFPKELCDEIILVDDASGDGTFELAQRLGITSFENPINLGYGGNMKQAIKIALEHGADVIIDIHPDGEYKSTAIPAALKEVRNGAKLVLGNRFYDSHKPTENGMYAYKLLPLYILNKFAKWALNIPVDDVHQGFRVYTKDLLEKSNYEKNSNDYLFSFEIIAQAAYNHLSIKQVPVDTNYTGNKRGASLKKSIIYSLSIFKVIFQYFLARIGFLQTKIFKKPTK